MKKLAVVLTFVFGVAMIAPAFAADPVKKEAAKTECTKDGHCRLILQLFLHGRITALNG